MKEDWILLHFDATFDHWSVAGEKEHIISLKNKETDQSAAHSKIKNAEICWMAEKLHPRENEKKSFFTSSILKVSNFHLLIKSNIHTSFIIYVFK